MSDDVLMARSQLATLVRLHPNDHEAIAQARARLTSAKLRRELDALDPEQRAAVLASLGEVIA
jgi:hypothetical protein